MSLHDNKIIFTKPEEYLRFYKHNCGSIETTKVIPPKLGSAGFGSIEVTLKYSFCRESEIQRLKKENAKRREQLRSEAEALIKSEKKTSEIKQYVLFMRKLAA